MHSCAVASPRESNPARLPAHAAPTPAHRHRRLGHGRTGGRGLPGASAFADASGHHQVPRCAHAALAWRSHRPARRCRARAESTAWAAVNLALIDAAALSDALAHLPLPRALAHCSAVRRAHLHFYQYATHWTTPFFQSNIPPLGRMRDIAFPITQHIPSLGRQMTATMAGGRTGPFASLNLRTPASPQRASALTAPAERCERQPRQPGSAPQR